MSAKSKREHFQSWAVVVFSATTNIHNNKQLYEFTFELVQKMHKFKCQLTSTHYCILHYISLWCFPFCPPFVLLH